VFSINESIAIIEKSVKLFMGHVKATAKFSFGYCGDKWGSVFLMVGQIVIGRGLFDWVKGVLK